MKILITAPRVSGHGGTETVIRKWLDNNIFKNDDITLFVARMSDDTWLQDIGRDIQIIDGGFSKLGRIFSYLKLLIFNSFDLIIDTNTTTIYVDSMVRKLLNKKYKIISWLHFSLLNVKSIDVDKIKYADAHIAISQQIAEQIRQYDKSHSILTAYNPVNLNVDNIPLKKIGILKLLYIGRIEWKHQKNLSCLFQTLSRFPRDTYHLDVYGMGKDIEICRNYSNYYDLNITFHGWKEEVWHAIDYDVDALVMTSTFEGFPMVIGEALARGIPVISSDCPSGPNEMITNNINGYLFPVNDENTLYFLIHKLFDQRKYWNQKIINQSIEHLSEENYFQMIYKYLIGIINNEKDKNKR